MSQHFHRRQHRAEDRADEPVLQRIHPGSHTQLEFAQADLHLGTERRDLRAKLRAQLADPGPQFGDSLREVALGDELGALGGVWTAAANASAWGLSMAITALL